VYSKHMLLRKRCYSGIVTSYKFIEVKVNRDEAGNSLNPHEGDV